MKETMNDRIKGGIYLVIDPSLPQDILFEKLKQVLKAGIDVLQIWDHWNKGVDKRAVIDGICRYCQPYGVPVIINNEWELLNDFPLKGVHFDDIPENYEAIKRKIKGSFFAGLTCNDDLGVVSWAEENAFHYISFCSMFPSATSTSCTLVSFETVRKARRITTMPIFLAGGITLARMEEFTSLTFDGIALVSGIMNSENPVDATKHYAEKLSAIKQTSFTKLL